MNEEIKNALESLHDPLVYKQALVDCRNLLNLSQATLEEHFQQWLWVGAEQDAYTGGELAYAIQLGLIEEHLVMNSLIYNE